MNAEQTAETAETSAALAVSQLERSYDAEVKNFLKEKAILVVILKSCVKEFRTGSCSVQEIAEKYIEGTPQVSAVAVDQDAGDPTAGAGCRIAGLSNEDTSPMERSVNRMCNLSYGIRLEGREEGIAVGKAEGRAEGIAVGKAEGIAVGKAEGIKAGKAAGIEVGRAEGIAIGKMNNLYELAGKGLLSLHVAAEEAGQTEEEFRNGLNNWLEQRTSE